MVFEVLYIYTYQTFISLVSSLSKAFTYYPNAILILKKTSTMLASEWKTEMFWTFKFIHGRSAWKCLHLVQILYFSKNTTVKLFCKSGATFINSNNFQLFHFIIVLFNCFFFIILFLILNYLILFILFKLFSKSGTTILIYEWFVGRFWGLLPFSWD